MPGRVGHAFDGRLVGEEVAAVRGLLEVHFGRVALALRVHARVDTALRADRVGPLHRHEREEVNGDACFAELDDGHEAGEAASDDDDAADLAGFGDDAALLGHALSGCRTKGERPKQPRP